LGVGQLNRLLRVHSRIALDTSVFIYQLQANPKYVGLTDEIFVWLQRAKSQGVTSTITLTELLVPNLAWIAPSLEIADTAARLRAEHGLRTPDALQAATAISSSATALVTNDATFRKLPGVQIIVLDDLL